MHREPEEDVAHVFLRLRQALVDDPGRLLTAIPRAGSQILTSTSSAASGSALSVAAASRARARAPRRGGNLAKKANQFFLDDEAWRSVKDVLPQRGRRGSRRWSIAH